MVFLYGDDNPRERFPWVHYLLMATWILVFFWAHANLGQETPRVPTHSFQEKLASYALIPYDLDYFLSWRTFTTLFLHLSIVSLVLNLFLLWIVGDNVESELGHFGYFLAFFGFCFLGHLVHFFLVYASVFSSSYIIGPSAGIAGILGMYLYLFPQARLKAYVFRPPLRFDKIYLSRAWAILYWLLVPFFVYLYSLFQPPLLNKYDVPLAVHVHYGVHFGFVFVGAFVAGIFNLFRGKSVMPDIPLRTASEKFLLREKQLEKKFEHVQKQTSQITKFLYENPEQGLQEYLKFSFQNPNIVLEPDSQLECAYAFLDRSGYEEAREVLENYLSHYPNGPYLAEAQLLLGEIYSRDPFLYEEAIILLEKAIPFLEGDLEQRANATRQELQNYFKQIQDTPLADNVPCVLLSQNINPKKTEKLADILTCFQNIPRADALKLFSRTKGILAKGISADKALLAANVIQQEAKFPVLVVPESKFASLPEKIEIQKVEISKEGLRFYRGTKEIFFRKFSDIHLICAIHYQAPTKGSSSKAELWFDFFVFNPKVRFQMQEGTYQSTKLQMEQDHLSGVATREVSAKKFAQLLKKYAKNTALNLGVCIQADRGDWSKVTFEEEDSYQEYCRWLLQLQTHAKRSLPALKPASVS